MMDDLYNYTPYNVSFANQMSDYSNQLYYHLGALAFAGIVLSTPTGLRVVRQLQSGDQWLQSGDQ